MNDDINKNIASLFSKASGQKGGVDKPRKRIAFSYLFFSDVRKDVSDREKYRFARELVEFADASGFEAVYFPERHFHEFGSIYANNGIVAAYFAPLTKNVRLRTAAVTATLHHPIEIVENWAMIDVLSDGRVDLGFGNGWNKADFVTSPDTYANRIELRNEVIPVIQKLWRGEAMNFVGPDAETFSITVYPRPIQPELKVWYVTTSDQGFAHAGKQGYNVFTMLAGIDLKELERKISIYRQARTEAALDPGEGIVTLMMHTFVHPDAEYVQKAVASPFKDYIRSTVLPHMKAAGRTPDEEEVSKMVEYSYARYFKTGGIFGAIHDCEQQVLNAIGAGVDEIAFLQDFGVDYHAVSQSLAHLEKLVSKFK